MYVQTAFMPSPLACYTWSSQIKLPNTIFLSQRTDIAMVLQILYHKLPVRTNSSWELKIAKCGNLMTCTCIIILFSRSVLKIFMYKPPIDTGKLIYTICSSHDIAEIQLKLALNINQSTNWHTAIKFENKNTTIYNYGLHEK